jgi:hypothetical protein
LASTAFTSIRISWYWHPSWSGPSRPTATKYSYDPATWSMPGKSRIRDLDTLPAGTQAILERYRKSYPNREAMGTLTFSEIEVRPLTTGLALVTGKFELKCTPVGGPGFRPMNRIDLAPRFTSLRQGLAHDVAAFEHEQIEDVEMRRRSRGALILKCVEGRIAIRIKKC